jgi:ABC-type dipeptide/oligopeptide/nickel transport system permease subunit
MWRRFRKNPLAVAGLVIVAALVLVAALAPWIAPRDPLRIEIENITAPPSAGHWMGTDDLGRDILSRLIHGARISLQVGVITTLVAIGLGILIGGISGFLGGWADTVIMRINDIVMAIPTPLFAIAIMAVYENPSINKIFLVLGFIGWPSTARLVRGQVRLLQQMEYAQAARAIGASPARILFRHLLPNTISPIIVMASLIIPGNILTEAWLSFLGLGVQAPQPSWGAMITEGQAYLQSKPWVCIFPGLAIMVTVLGFNLMGDGIRDVLDPRLNKGK